MVELLNKNITKFKDYANIYFENKYKYNYTLKVINKQTGKRVFLKVYDDELIKKGPEDYIYKQIKREINLTKLCQCENIIKLNNTDDDILKINEKIDKKDKDIIILEYELYNDNLSHYLKENGKLSENINFFIKIVKAMANALEILYEQKIIHRDIKPFNIYIKKKDFKNDEADIEDNCIILLGDLGSSIKIEENDSKPIGTILYAAPEILKNIKYDEKIDLWSLGVTLYHLYFGFPPYSVEYDLYSIREKIFTNNLLYKFSGIPTLDILFKKLLQIEPKNRMNHKEFCEYVRSEEFMHPKKLYKEEIYRDIYKEIRNIMETQEYRDLKMDLRYKDEGKDKGEEKLINKQIARIAKLTTTPNNILDIFLSMEKIEKQIYEIKYINILYYNETKKYTDIKDEIYLFEEHTTGTFIFCDNLEKLKIIMYEISLEGSVFCLIINSASFEKIINYLKENKYNGYFSYICIFVDSEEEFLSIIEKLENYKDIKKIHIIKTKEEIIENFIEKYKSKKKFKPYPATKLISYEDYKNNKYYLGHLMVSGLYGELNAEMYNKNITNIEKLINKDKNMKKNEEMKNAIFESFKIFDVNNINTLNEKFDEKIIEEYTNNTFYGDLNRWLRDMDIFSFEEIAYFTSRLMLSLNIYGKRNNYYNFNEKTLYRGIELDYISLLAYERAKGKIIIFSSFTSTTENEEIAKKKFGRFGYSNGNFSVLFYIINVYKDGWISNGINIQDISQRKSEQEIIYQPFTFYIMKDVEIDIIKEEAKIYLETIGKKEILEEEIKKGKNIEYNKEENIIESI